MADYHVGCGFAGIYAGTMKKNGCEWQSKSDVTKEAILAVAQYFLENDKSMSFNYQGKRYVLEINEVVAAE